MGPGQDLSPRAMGPMLCPARDRRSTLGCMSKGAHEPERIVVGVSQSPASRYAVLWAAQEARIRRSVLLVTHVDPPSAYAPDLHDAATACHRLLANSATVASEAQPSVAVGTLLLTGSISDELIRLSRQRP